MSTQNTTCSRAYPPVLYAGQVVVLLLGDHEGSQVGGVGSQEDDGEERPDVREEAAGDAARSVCGHSRTKQHCPDQPEGAEQRELVHWGTNTKQRGCCQQASIGRKRQHTFYCLKKVKTMKQHCRSHRPFDRF